MKKEFKKCCAHHISSVWREFGNPMNILHYVGTCPDCNHFIGLTQTTEEQASKFLSNYNLN